MLITAEVAKERSKSNNKEVNVDHFIDIINDRIEKVCSNSGDHVTDIFSGLHFTFEQFAEIKRILIRNGYELTTETDDDGDGQYTFYILSWKA